MNHKQALTGHVLALATVMVWGTTFISTKVLLRSFTPVEILFIRFVIGFIALMAAYPHRMKLTQRKHELYFAAAGLSGVTLYFLMENIALTYTLASNVGVIVSVAPFFTAIAAHIFLDGEKLKPPFFIGFLAALAGICFISFSGSTLKLDPIGDVLAVLAALDWAIYSILMKKIGALNYGTVPATRRTFFYGLIFMIPALVFFGFKPEAGALIKPVNLFNLLFLGLGASALCFASWNFALKLLGAVKTSVYIYLVPVITVICSFLMLHEPITPLALIGMLLTLLGLFISENRLPLRRKKTGGEKVLVGGESILAAGEDAGAD